MPKESNVKLMVGENTIKSITVNPFQQAEQSSDKSGRISYNRIGAITEAKRQKAGWEASDQFIGRKLWIQINATE